MHTKDYKNRILVILSIPLVFLIICIGTSIGSSNINILDTISILGNKLFNIPIESEIAATEVVIIWSVRLPRVILAFIVGGALAVSGAVTQSILKNNLASPYTLGVSSGASLGVGMLIITGVSIGALGNLTMPVVGFFSSLISMLLVLKISRKADRSMSNTTIILVGMVFSLFASAMLTTASALATEKMQSIAMWQMGSFGMKGWDYVKVGIPFYIVGIIGVMVFVREMDILTFGEDVASSLGVNTIKVKRNLFILVSVLTGSAVALSGVIGFIDLIAPHIVRKIFGSKHIYVIPMSAVFGGCMMVITDLISRTIIAPSQLPVGAITALIGAPFFAYIYFSKSK